MQLSRPFGRTNAFQSWQGHVLIILLWQLGEERLGIETEVAFVTLTDKNTPEAMCRQ
jgi:hypothetical protein